MNGPHYLCLVIDGLRASAVGAYGNTISPTPALDAFAAEAAVCDTMLCYSPRLADFYRAAWRGEGPVARVSDCEKLALPRAIEAAGGRFSFITDDPACEGYLPADAVNGATLVAGMRASTAAATVEDTAFFRLMAEAAGVIEADLAASDPDAGPRHVWWIHSQGLAGSWDAPTGLREALRDEEDGDEAEEIVEVPGNVALEDPDAVWEHRLAYAAQVSVFDECIGGLLAALEDLGIAEQTTVLVAGARGFALGEHGRVGGEVDALYSERLHVPCFVRRPCALGPVARQRQILQPAWIGDQIRGAFGLAPLVRHWPEAALAVGCGGEFSLRTPQWYLHRTATTADDAGGLVELYAKPDDRWESNEVASLCPDVVDALMSQAADMLSPAGRDRPECEP